MGVTETKTIELPQSITVRELAQRIEASPIDVMKILMANGVMANINQLVDFDTAAIVLSEMGVEAIQEISLEELAKEDKGSIPLWRRMLANEDPKSLVHRSPVVTILGHVDHGKTTLLDAIRHTNVAEGESGGITQHIGAYQVEHNGKKITFLDTPGHAAFTAMRARGAQGADIVVLVIAADDGVMPQTREAIAHAKAAQVPIIVALNKMDRPGADSNRIKQQLAENGLIPDDWDGDTMVVPISAKKSTGLDDLLEAILLVSDDLKILANPKGKVFGTVIEAEVGKSQGVMATLLVQSGTLHDGDVVVMGNVFGRIRAMFDFRGKKVHKVDPSSPVSVMGLHGVPVAGDLFQTVESEREARQIVEERKILQIKVTEKNALTLEQLFARFQAGELQDLRLIVKADVQGSIEPIVSSLKDLSSEEIKVNIIHSETGNISENDVMLAVASKAIIIGFNVKEDTGARRYADNEGVSIRNYDIIYRMIEDIEKALKGMLEPELREKVIGRAEVRAVYKVSKLGNIAGCRVVEGELRRNGRIRVVRNGKTLHEGEIASLKHFQEDVKEVRQGFDCGVGVKGFMEYAPGDSLICFVLEKTSF
ncbi:MAG: translation initiation factor IF-2 [Chloroflexota bacterium]